MPFKSDRDIIRYSRQFLRGRITLLRKDIGICLTANRDGSHAYFPALITCIAFLELVAGLHAGKLDGVTQKDLEQYATRFMNAKHYDHVNLTVLYQGFRHKIAHLGHPYVTWKTERIYGAGKPARIAWTVFNTNRTLPIELIAHAPRCLEHTMTPWAVQYDHRAKISIHRLKVDTVKSIYGPKGFLAYLATEAHARARFARCMEHYYPT